MAVKQLQQQFFFSLCSLFFSFSLYSFHLIEWFDLNTRFIFTIYFVVFFFFLLHSPPIIIFSAWIVYIVFHCKCSENFFGHCPYCTIYFRLYIPLRFSLFTHCNRYVRIKNSRRFWANAKRYENLIIITMFRSFFFSFHIFCRQFFSPEAQQLQESLPVSSSSLLMPLQPYNQDTVHLNLCFGTIRFHRNKI